MADETQNTSTLEDGSTPAVTVETVKEEVDAQVVQPREPDADKVQVHEVRVTTDTVITDPTSDLAVQTPPEGRGSLDLPIHKLDAPSAEQVFEGEDAAEGQQTEPTPNVDVPKGDGVNVETKPADAPQQPSDS